MNEFALIRLIRELVPSTGEKVIKGVGDDAAVLPRDKETYSLFTCDILVENVHFSLDYTPLPDLGWKALAVSVSDIAAMGGVPESALISLGLPKKDPSELVTGLYQGVKEFCHQFSVSLVGGNISSARELVVDVAMLGKVEKKNFVLREGAQPGDSIVVTGTLGDSSAGRELLKEKRNKSRCSM